MGNPAMILRAGPVAFLFVAFAVAPAAAQVPGSDTSRLRTFCAGDYAQLCPGLDPRGPEVVACFRRNVASVSPGCREAISEFRARSPKGATAKP